MRTHESFNYAFKVNREIATYTNLDPKKQHDYIRSKLLEINQNGRNIQNKWRRTDESFNYAFKVHREIATHTKWILKNNLIIIRSKLLEINKNGRDYSEQVAKHRSFKNEAMRIKNILIQRTLHFGRYI